MTTIITKQTICTECEEERARRFVAYLRAEGWEVEFGGTGPTPEHQPLLSGDFPAFNEAYYDADAATWRVRR